MTIFNSYETGTATEANDLIGKLKTFLESNSFTVEDYFQEGLGQRLHVSKNGFYYNLKSFINEVPFSQPSTTEQNDWQNTDVEPYNSGICMCVSNSYDNLLDYDRQPGSMTENYAGNENDTLEGNPILLTDGAITEYDFFYNGKTVYIACQFNPGYYSHLQFGEIDKIGEYSGGSYCSGSYYHNFDTWGTSDTPRPALYFFNGSDRSFYMNQILINNSVRKMTGLLPDISSGGNSPTYDVDYVRKSKNPFLSGKGTLIPELFYVEEENSLVSLMPIGTINGLFNVYFENYTPKEIVSVGSRRYVVFPYWQKPSPWDDTIKESSGTGVAIQVDEFYTG